MSMDFTEFKRKIGAEPNSRDPELLAAREASPEFAKEARAAEQLEEKLARAFALPVPDDLLDRISDAPSRALADTPARSRPRWRNFAMAASLLVAVGAAGLVWNANRGWDSVGEYVVDHYRHDGPGVISSAGQEDASRVQSILAEFNVVATPELADIVGVIKYCPTPDGKGLHMVLNTGTGPVTVIYMPATPVQDREILEFDGNEAMLVELRSGSAAIIGTGGQGIEDLHAMMQSSILPLNGRS